MIETPTFALRPMTLGELLDQSFRLYRRNFVTFVGIVGLAQIPYGLAQLLTSLGAILGVGGLMASGGFSNEAMTAFLFGGLALAVFLAIVSGLAQTFAAAAISRSVLGSYLGAPVGIMDAYRQVGPKASRLLGAMLLLGLLSLGMAAWSAVPCVGWLTGIGMIFSFSALVFTMLTPVVMVENFGAWDSIVRSWVLVRRRFWWMLGFVSVLWLLSMLITLGPTYALTSLLTWLMQLLPVKDTSVLLAIQSILQALVTAASMVLYLPLQLTAMTVVYFDLRTRTEGLDLALRSSIEQGQAVDENQLSDTASLEKEPLITRKDLINFFLVSLLVVVLYVLLYAILFGIMMLFMPSF